MARSWSWFGQRKFWISILAVGIFLLPIAFLFLPSREPVYEGKPFSFWLDQLPITILSGGGESRMFPMAYKNSFEADADRERIEKMNATAMRALDYIGKDCLPELAARLRSRDSRLRIVLQYWAMRLHLIKPVQMQIDGPSAVRRSLP